MEQHGCACQQADEAREIQGFRLSQPWRTSSCFCKIKPCVGTNIIHMFHASPTWRSQSTALRPLAGMGQLLPPPQSWAPVPAALWPALHNLHEISESAWMRNGEILWKRSRSNGNVKNIKKGKEDLPSEPLCLNTSRFLVRIMVFTSLTSKFLLVTSSYTVPVQNPGSKSTTLGFQITEGKIGSVLIKRQRCPLAEGEGKGPVFNINHFGADLSPVPHRPMVPWNRVE